MSTSERADLRRPGTARAEAGDAARASARHTAGARASVAGEASSQARAARTDRPARSGRPGEARQARLVLAKVDPWSVMKLAFLLALATMIMVMTAVYVLWNLLDGMGVFTTATQFVTDVTASDTSQGIDLAPYFERDQVLTVAAMLAGVNLVLLTAIATLGAFLYNISSALVGGLHVTLREDS